MKDVILFLWAGLISFLVWFFGEADGALKLLLTLIVIDYISGVCVGWFEHKLSSSIGFKGIAGKILMLTLVGIANLFDRYIFGQGTATKAIVCLFYVSNEGISILENVHKLGLPIPEVLLKHFTSICEKKDKEEGKS